MQTLLVGEYTPDLPSLSGSCTDAKNVIPATKSYRSFPQAVVYSNALTARAQGFISTRDAAANVYNYSGDATKLYTLVGQTWTDASRLAGGAYAITAEDYWEFVSWGNTVIATDFADVVQEISLGSANFIALAGSPPQARHIAVVRDFVVLGNISTFPQRVQWSAINNSHSWAVSGATQADFQDLAGDGGWVQRVVGGEYGVIFQERSIWRMSYIGSPVIFQFDLVDRQRGTPAPMSVVSYGNITFYLADDGFYYFNGSASVPIGNGKFDKTFLSEVDSTYLYRVQAAIDPVNKIVCWLYPVTGGGGVPSKVAIYNWADNRWSYAIISGELLALSAAQGYTLDGLDAVTTNLDSLTPSLDSRAWTGGKINFGMFDTSHKLNTFTGTAMSAQIDVGETQHSPYNRSYVTDTRPLVEGGTASVTVGSRNTLVEVVTYSGASTQDNTGACQHRVNARYHRYRIIPVSDFTHVGGVQVSFREEGDR